MIDLATVLGEVYRYMPRWLLEWLGKCPLVPEAVKKYVSFELTRRLQ